MRTTRRLERAPARITMLQQELDEYYARFRVSIIYWSCNLVQVAELIVRCAMLRKESRRGFTTLDHPDQFSRERAVGALAVGSLKKDKVLGQSGKSFGILLLWPTDDQSVASTPPPPSAKKPTEPDAAGALPFPPRRYADADASHILRPLQRRYQCRPEARHRKPLLRNSSAAQVNNVA